MTVITQKLLEEKLKQPKMQILINPFVQSVFSKLPSIIHNRNYSFLTQIGLSIQKLGIWYLGIDEMNEEYTEIIDMYLNNKMLKLANKTLATKYLSYFDVKKIPDEYKKGKSYYDNYDLEKIKESILDESELKVKSNITIEKLTRYLNINISSLFVESEKLVGLPKAYIIVYEWDELKDEGLLYAERLKEANVDVKVAFYEKAFHGMHALINKLFGFDLAMNIQKDLMEYLKKNL